MGTPPFQAGTDRNLFAGHTWRRGTGSWTSGALVQSDL